MTSTTWVQNAGMDSGTDSDTVLTYAEAAQAAAEAAAASVLGAAEQASASSGSASDALAAANAAAASASSAETFANSASIATVATNISNVNTVAGSIAAVSSVAGGLGSINTVAAEIDALIDIQDSVVAAGVSASDAQSYATQSQDARDTASLHKLAAEAAATSATNTAAALTGFDLEAIAATKTVTAVDVFVYDTSKDSDGGAWRKRTQGTSWYNETMNTSTRGSRKEFPAVAVIVAEATKVTIYDGDDPSLPMWMVFNTPPTFSTLIPSSSGTAVPSCVSLLNGRLLVGNKTFDLVMVDFSEDTAYKWSNVSKEKSSFNISQRNVTTYSYSGNFGAGISARAINDVAMTVLPDAPIDSATGLQVPTIAVVTNGGVSVIKDDGTVVSSGSTIAYNKLAILDDTLYAKTASSYYGLDWWPLDQITSGDIKFTGARPDNQWIAGKGQGAYVNAMLHPPTFFSNVVAAEKDTLLISGGAGFSQYRAGGNAGPLVNYQKPDSLACQITSTFNTGYQTYLTKGAFLSDTDDTDLVGGTDNDRSVNANPLTVNGTVTRTAVATGADLVAYSGFSASNYLEQPYNADLDFGTGDFCVMGWVKFSDVAPVSIIFRKGDIANTTALNVYNQGGQMYFVTRAASLTSQVIGSGGITNNTWVNFAVVRSASGTKLEVYINGVLSNSASVTARDISSTEPVFIGTGSSDTSAYLRGSLALLRIGATAPSAEQIAKIYNDEKVLFQEGAQATLYGSSDAVTALAHDDTTNLLHVGTSAGRSVFQGLRRVSNTTTAVGTAISASNGLVVEE